MSTFAENNLALNAGRNSMAEVLAKANVPTLDYQAFAQNAMAFSSKLGNHSTRDWVPELARGASSGLYAEVKATAGNALSAIRESAGNIFSELSGSGTAAAREAYTTLGNNVGSAIGLPPVLTGALIQSTQKTVVDGLGSVGSSLLAQVGLGALSGGVSIIAGGLISMALGSFFGKDKAPPAVPPEKKTRTIQRAQSDPPQLDSVFEEILTAVVRWRKDGLGYVDGYEAGRYVNALLVPTGYLPRTRRTPNLSGEFTSRDVIDKGLTPYVFTSTDWQWLGPPLPWALATDPIAKYNFNHDCLARWVGYNLNLSLATQEILANDFSDRAVSRRSFGLQAWLPYLSAIGWAEFIVAGFLASLWKFEPFGKAGPPVWQPIPNLNPVSPRGAAIGGPNLYNMMRAIQRTLKDPKSFKQLSDMVAGDPLKNARAALAHVTIILRGSMAVAANMALHEELTTEHTNDIKRRIQTWRDEKLSLIGATGSPQVQRNVQDLHNQDARERDNDQSSKKLRAVSWLVPAALGLAAVGGGIYLARRR